MLAFLRPRLPLVSSWPLTGMFSCSAVDLQLRSGLISRRIFLAVARKCRSTPQCTGELSEVRPCLQTAVWVCTYGRSASDAGLVHNKLMFKNEQKTTTAKKHIILFSAVNWQRRLSKTRSSIFQFVAPSNFGLAAPSNFGLAALSNFWLVAPSNFWFVTPLKKSCHTIQFLFVCTIKRLVGCTIKLLICRTIKHLVCCTIKKLVYCTIKHLVCCTIKLLVDCTIKLVASL